MAAMMDQRTKYALYQPNVFRYVLMLLFVLAAFLILQGLFSTKVGAYQHGYLIDDAIFLDAKSMNASQIQTFLNSKSGVLKSRSFKLDCDAPGIGGTAKQLYIQAGASCGSTVPASQIIYYTAQVYGVNPKVIIATLQKEQSLITDSSPSARAINQAMGYACPTSGVCDSSSSFFWQIDNGTWVLRFHFERARKNNNWWYTSSSWTCGTAKTNYYSPNLYPRQNVKFYDPYSKVHYVTVYIQNAATSAFYCYTPHVFNNHSNSPHPDDAKNPRCYSMHPASGSKGRCYTGSYNFVKAYENWFGPTTGTPFFKISGSDRVYIEGTDNNYYYISSSSMIKSYGFGKSITKVDTYNTNYLNGKTYSGSLPHIARFGSEDEVYIVNQGNLYHIPSRDMLEKYGLTLGSEARLPEKIKGYYPIDSVVSDILVRADGPGVYLVDNSKKHHIINAQAYNSLGSPVYSSRPTVKLDSYFVNTLPFGGPIMKNGSTVKAIDSGKEWVWVNNKLSPLAPTVSNSWQLPVTYSEKESILTQLPIGNDSFSVRVRSPEGVYYILDNKNKIGFTIQQLAAFGLDTSGFTVTSTDILDRFSLKNIDSLSLVRETGKDPVYKVSERKLIHIFSREEANHYNINLGDTVEVNTSTIKLFTAEGNVLLMPGRLMRNGSSPSVYLVNSDTSKKHVPSRNVLDQYGYSLNMVISVNSEDFQSYTEHSPVSNLVRFSDGSHWLVDKGNRYKIAPGYFATFGYNQQNFSELSQIILSRLTKAQPLTPFLSGPDGRVYKIEGGKKRWYSSRSAFERGRSWADVRQVSTSYINSFDDGHAIY